jgi:cytidylate kinase
MLTDAVHDTSSTLEVRHSGTAKASVRQRDVCERLDMSLVERGKMYRAFVGFKAIMMDEVV